MNRTADAIIVGAGVIGASVAFELAKRGYKTLNIDKLPTSGYGSTSNSCAIVRAHYSTWDGVAMAYEGFFYFLVLSPRIPKVEVLFVYTFNGLETYTLVPK